MNWLAAIGAGLVEIAWAQSIRPTHCLTRFWPSLVCMALVAVVVLLLSLAMATLPVGTAYTVFTGIGTIGAVVLGVLIHRDPMHPARSAALALICGGIVLAHAAE